MGFRMWLGGHFDTGHERRALMQLLQEAVARWRDEPAPFALFVDFQVGEARMDLVAVTDHALVVIDLKEGGSSGGVVRGSLNGEWSLSFPDGTGWKLNKDRPKNPYQQINDYRWEMVNWLNANGPSLFGAQVWQSMNASRIDAWVVVAPGIDEAATERELAQVRDRQKARQQRR